MPTGLPRWIGSGASPSRSAPIAAIQTSPRQWNENVHQNGEVRVGVPRRRTAARNQTFFTNDARSAPAISAASPP